MAPVASFPTSIPNGQNRVRCRIIGTFKGRTFEYTDSVDSTGSQFIWGNGGEPPDPSHYWWSQGGMSCDCNRVQFIPDDLHDEITGCGESILIDTITPLVEGWPILTLNESTEGHS